MRIGIEAQRLFRPEKHGMDRAALELVKQLQRIDTENEYFVFVRPDEDRQALQETDNFKVVEIPGGSYPVWEQLQLPKAVKQYKLDVLHCTSNTAPLFTSTPLVTTIHDIIYLEGKLLELFKGKATRYQKFGNLYRRLIVPAIARKSQAVITVSGYEKEHMGAHFGGKTARKLTAIHNGVSTHFKMEQDPAKLQAVREAYKLPQRYLLHFGSMDPRKNSRRVLEAFQLLCEAGQSDHQLVLLSYSEEALKADLQALEATDLMERILLPGYVADQDLPAIYQLADLFLFPSLREGFGIPIIEAMACGTPVITANTSSMPEVAGEAAHLVDPTNVWELLNGINRILTDTAYRDSLVAKGLKQQAEFSWESMAQKVLATYHTLVQH